LDAHTLPIPVSDPQLPVQPAVRVTTTALSPPSAATDTSAPRVARREQHYRRLLALADVLAASLALLLCAQLAGRHQLPWASLLTLPLVVLTSKVMGLYDRDELVIRKTTLNEVPAIFRQATVYALLFSLIDGDLRRVQVVALWLGLFAFTFLLRVAARRAAAEVSDPERILFVGDARAYANLSRKLAEHGLRGDVVGRLSIDDWVTGGVAGEDFAVLGDVVATLDVHRLIVMPDEARPDATLELVRAAKVLGIRISVLPRILEVVGSSVEFDDLFGMPVLGVRRFGLTRSSEIVKRAFDLAVGLAALLILGPLMAAIALLIKLDSNGPVLFRQERMGRDGRVFRICKYRTMCDGADHMKADLEHLNEAGDGFFKIADDPRITRVGKFLRRTSLDELPQLFNVVVGEMSVVGPRPLVLAEDEKIVGWDRRRLSLTPGMTGPWQILGSSRVPLNEMVKIDYLYAAGWSLWGDLKILLRTIPYVLARRGL